MQQSLQSALVRFVLDNQASALVVLDASGRLACWNRSATGIDLDIAGLFVGDESDERIAAFVDELRACGKGYTIVASARGRVFRLDGTAVQGWLIVLIHDVSEQRDVEEELRELRSRASDGLVAASLIHDFNNLLTPILLLSARLKRELGEGGGVGAIAAEIHSSATLAGSLARDVLALARPRVPMIERTSINETVRDLEGLLGRLLGDRIQLVLSLDDGAGDATIDRKGLEHAILNLVVNARDASPEGGSVSIATRVLDHEQRTRIALSVIDTGTGMTEDVRSRALETFFTTRTTTGGMGLGLASVLRFARESGGDVSIDSEPRRGTTVTIFLDPSPAAIPAPASSTDPRDPGGVGERVLVADRDEGVRKSIELALQAYGYVAVLADSQDGAIELAAAHPVRVAILDAALLHRSPATFLHQLRALAPKLRFVLLTESARAAPVPETRIVVLPKPFGDAELVRAVRSAIAPRASWADRSGSAGDTDPFGPHGSSEREDAPT